MCARIDVRQRVSHVASAAYEAVRILQLRHYRNRQRREHSVFLKYEIMSGRETSEECNENIQRIGNVRGFAEHRLVQILHTTCEQRETNVFVIIIGSLNQQSTSDGEAGTTAKVGGIEPSSAASATIGSGVPQYRSCSRLAII